MSFISVLLVSVGGPALLAGVCLLGILLSFTPVLRFKCVAKKRGGEANIGEQKPKRHISTTASVRNTAPQSSCDVCGVSWVDACTAPWFGVAVGGSYSMVGQGWWASVSCACVCV